MTTCIGYVEATIRFPLYEGDKLSQDFTSSVDYIIEQPGIRRVAECLTADVVKYEAGEEVTP
jgi:hypothetical protein